jgi:hypothetical protein
MPAAVQPAAAVLATAGEVIFAIALITGFRLREAAIGAGVLLTFFGISMALALGMKAPLDYSVFTAATASFSLAVMAADHKRDIREAGHHDSTVSHSEDISRPAIGAALVESAERHFGGLDKFDSGTRWPSFTTQGDGR